MYNFVYLGYIYDYYCFMYNNISIKCSNVFFCTPPSQEKCRIKKHFYNYLAKCKFRSIARYYNSLFIAKDIKSKLRQCDNICFVVYYGVILNRGIEFIKDLKRAWPNARVVFQLTDTVDHCKKLNSSFDLDTIKRYSDVVLSYNEMDSEQYGLTIERPKVVDYSSVFCDDCCKETSIDAYYIGRDKGRLDQIISIYEFLEKKGLKCQFYVVGVPREKQILPDKINYTDYIPYSKNCLLASRSKCIVNLIQSGAEGITLRDYEAIGMNKLLITNNPSIYTSEFYTKEKVIDANNLEREFYKITDVSSNTWNGIDKYSVENYYKWLSELLDLKK